MRQLAQLSPLFSPSGATLDFDGKSPAPRNLVTAFLTNAADERLPLATTSLIGRVFGSTIRLPGRGVASHHCVITRLAAGGDLLVCLDSCEGTQLNHRRLLAPTLLQPGDVLHIGPHRLVYGTGPAAPPITALAPRAPATTGPPPSPSPPQLTATGVVAFSPDGRTILWASQQVQTWFPKYFPTGAKTRVHSGITAWLAQIARHTNPPAHRRRRAGRELVLRLVERVAAHCLVTVSEKEVLNAAGISRLFQVSQREGEVLYWLVMGKDRTEVGKILGISKRTVGKHCEHLFTKLGVTHRAAAVRLVVASGALR